MDFSKRDYLMAEVAVSQTFSEFREGNIIFQKGDKGSTMYEVVRGSVGIYIHYGKENEQLLVTKNPGEFFGEIALLEKRVRTATAVALEDETVLEETSSSEGFVAYVRKHPHNLEVILDMMSDRFKTQRANYLNACIDFADYKNAVENGEEISPELSEKIDKYMIEAERSRDKEWF